MGFTANKDNKLFDHVYSSWSKFSENNNGKKMISN